MDSVSAQTGISQVRYSQVGTALASSAVAASEQADRWDVADEYLGTTLQSIAGGSETTPDEKVLARMGIAMGKGPDMSWRNSTKARHAVASAIASSMPGPIGVVLAQVALTAANKADRWDNADHFAGEGLKAVRDDAQTSNLEKSVATLGLRMGNGEDMTFENAARAQGAALHAVAEGARGPAPRVLAQVALAAYEKANRWDNADHFAGVGLQAVVDDAEATAVQKELARNALVATRRDVPYEGSAKARAQALKQIVQA